MAKTNINTWKYLDLADLVSSQIEVTRLSYNTHSAEYAENWEWNEEVKEITKRDYLNPFTKYLGKGVILVVGCGTGRDLKTLGEMGFHYLGIDSSAGMLKEAVEKRQVDGPVLCADLESINMADNSFDGILIDSAAEHIKKADMEWILEKLYKGLKKDGVLLIRFRVGTGKVFKVEDMVGTRYFTSYTKDESKDLVERNGFKVMEDYCSNHLEDSRPGFHAYILRK